LHAALSTERFSVAPCANAYFCAGFALVNSLAIPLKFPNVDIKAIQDDITIFGDPEDIFDEIDDGGEVIKLGALSLLIQELKARGLDCNKIKFACAGTQRQMPAQGSHRG
jgi:hypothetical protein